MSRIHYLIEGGYDGQFFFLDPRRIAIGTTIADVQLPCGHAESFIHDLLDVGTGIAGWILVRCRTCLKEYRFVTDDPKPEQKQIPRTGYHVVRDDLEAALSALGLRLVHDDGTEPGKSCRGYLVGRLHEASKRWQS